ncbi:hypothetical protein I2494_11040 [Budviciaceae bacterium BWR-B9]|uniref:RHS repeat protein n=2 Tax=Limnobaculum allomyrinae TaxID=2791986 RepID=A0ABS1IR63_9GAMM|nr:hypothetical protein [Limnobaculum sp. M2-1]MBK5144246.1 hypothetical protein [Limnobaculum allomyrinae]MBV7692009.1 hypothetical protein [Limnobaculum sp. M2-1]
MMTARFFTLSFFTAIVAFILSPFSYALTSYNSLTTKENAIFSANLVLTENASHSIFPPDYRVKKLEEVTHQNGEWVSTSWIDYDISGNLAAFERHEKNRRGESVTKIYKNKEGHWIKCIKWLMDGKESDVGKVIVRYLSDRQGRIVRSELMNSEWIREYVYNENAQLSEVVEKQKAGYESAKKYTVKKYYYNSKGFLARRDFKTSRNNFVSTYYFDYNDKDMLQRIVGEAIAYSTQKRRAEKYYTYFDRNYNWLQAEWGTEDNKFIQNRTIVYY